MTTAEATRQVRRLLGNARIFGATFIKANGERRTGAFRLGVRKNLVGTGVPGYNPEEHGNLIVWDMNAQGYRTIKLERVECLRVRGKEIRL